MKQVSVGGFTLIEMLAALTLLGLLSMGLFESFRLAQRVSVQSARVSEEMADVRITHRVVRRLLTGVAGPSGLRFRNGVMELVSSSTRDSPGFARHYVIETIQRPDGLLDLRVLEKGASDAELLIGRIRSAQWQFLSVGSSTPQRSWQTEWNSTEEKPALVRLLVSFPQGDHRRWPDLIVDTVVDEDAACEFDVVAQDCRRRS